MNKLGRWEWSSISTVTCKECKGEIETDDGEYILRKYKFCPLCAHPMKIMKIGESLTSYESEREHDT
jgi:hypothetical protein